jgi:hypothetical protein
MFEIRASLGGSFSLKAAASRTVISRIRSPPECRRITEPDCDRHSENHSGDERSHTEGCHEVGEPDYERQHQSQRYCRYLVQGSCKSSRFAVAASNQKGTSEGKQHEEDEPLSDLPRAHFYALDQRNHTPRTAGSNPTP